MDWNETSGGGEDGVANSTNQSASNTTPANADNSTTSSTNTSNNNASNSDGTVTMSTSSSNGDFSNLNTSNYDTNLNLNLNQLSQLISLSTSTPSGNGNSNSGGSSNGGVVVLSNHSASVGSSSSTSSSSAASAASNEPIISTDALLNAAALVVTGSGGSGGSTAGNNVDQVASIIGASDSVNSLNAITLTLPSNNVDKLLQQQQQQQQNTLSSGQLLMINKNYKLIELAIDSNNNSLFSIPLGAASDHIFLNELLIPTTTTTTTTTPSNTTTTTNTNNNMVVDLSSAAVTDVLVNRANNPNSNALNNNNNLKKYNYKCQYCLHLTKFKAHIIEHMLSSHNIDLMQCPYYECGRKFKDEWKLKRHLLTNKDHAKSGQFKDLNDCLRRHVYVTLQKVGQYPCPMCQVDESTGQVYTTANTQSGTDSFDQQSVIATLLGKNIDNSLYLDSYDMLRAHIAEAHPKFNMDNYFVCKQCGQVFLNRYKLSCHLFNVHSGKRKRRSTTALAQQQQNTAAAGANKIFVMSNPNAATFSLSHTQLANSSFNTNEIDDDLDEQLKAATTSGGGNSGLEFSDENITSIIDSVAKGLVDPSRGHQSQQHQFIQYQPVTLTNLKQQQQQYNQPIILQQQPQQIIIQQQPQQQQPQQQVIQLGPDFATAKKYLCIVCKRKFRRVRDLQTHVSIMHKTMSDGEREAMRAEIDKTNQLLVAYRRALKSGKRRRVVATASVVLAPIQQAGNRVCPICGKMFKNDAKGPNATANSHNKTFMRHMQIQHGLSEKGEKLVDCPVCEKWFFNRKQMERHMRTHQSWISSPQEPQQTTTETPTQTTTTTKTDDQETDKTQQNVVEYKEKHSILYCHECIECGIFFKSLKTLTRHKLERHSLRPVYKCAAEQCSSGQFDSVEEFLAHALVHPQKNIVCAKCSIKFNNKNLLRHHMKVAHYRPTHSAGGADNSGASTNATTTPVKRKAPTTKRLQKQQQPQILQVNQTRTTGGGRKKGQNAVTVQGVNILAALQQQQQHTPQKQHKSGAHSNDTTLTSSHSASNSATSTPSKKTYHHHHQHSTPTATATTTALSASTTSTSSSLHGVSANQSGGNNSDFICPTCQEEFTSKNALHNHLATHSSTDLKLFMCSLCTQSFKTRKELSQHAALAHDYVKHKTCSQCGETFKTSFHLKRHLLTRHSNIRPFRCLHCNMTFARKDKLKQHEAKHVNHPLYKCSQCTKGFYRKEHLKDHEISKHSKQYPFSCEHCQKGFVHAKDLHRHIRVRHLGAPAAANTTGGVSSSASSSTTTVNNSATINAANLLPINVISNNPQQQQQVFTLTNIMGSGINFQLPGSAASSSGGQIQLQITPTPSATASPHKEKQNRKNQDAAHNTSSSNDFKSKKISSILKANMYLNSSPSNTTVNTFPATTAVQQFQPLQQQQQQLFQQPQQLQSQQQQQLNKQFDQQQQQIQLIDFGTALNIQPTQNLIATSGQNNLINYTPQTIFTTSGGHVNMNNGLIKMNPHSFKIRDQLLITDSQISQPQQQQQQFQPQQQQLFNQQIQIQQTNSNANKLVANQTILQQQLQQQPHNNTINSILSSQQQSEQPAAAVQNQGKSKKGAGNNSNNNNEFRKSFVCPTCSQKFFYENHLKKHMLSKHSDTPQFLCSFCQKGFSTRATAKSHVENGHSEHICPICFKSFRTQSQTQRHMDKTHANEASNQKPIRNDKAQARIIDLSTQQQQQTATTTIQLQPTNQLIQNKQQQQQQQQPQQQTLNLISVNTNDLLNTNATQINPSQTVNSGGGTVQTFNLVNFSTYSNQLWPNNVNIMNGPTSSISPLSNASSNISNASPTTQQQNIFISAQHLQHLTSQQPQQQQQQQNKQVINIVGGQNDQQNSSSSAYFLN